MMHTLRTLRAVGSWATGKAAVVEFETLLDRGDREVPASVIVPRGASRPLPGWIVLHGITRPGRFHPTLLRFVRALASSQVSVIVPQVPEWKNLRLAPEVGLPTVRAALRGLRELDTANDGPYGLIGFSFGAAQAMIAAADEDVSEQLAGVVGFGGYCDMDRMVRFQMTGQHEWDGMTYQLRPDPYGRWIIGGNHLLSIPEYRDAQDVSDALWRLAMEAGERRILAWDPSYDAIKSTLREGISADRQWLFDLFAPLSDREPDPERAESLITRLSSAVMAASPLMNPVPFLERIRTRVQIIHGTNDHLIPYTETLRMAAAFPEGKEVEATITALFGHSGHGGRLSSIRHEIRESARLVRALHRVLDIA